MFALKEKLAKQQNDEQLLTAVKLAINSVYGLMGAQHYPIYNVYLAAAVTSVCRSALVLTNKYLINTLSIGKNPDIIHLNNTDSVMINCKHICKTHIIDDMNLVNPVEIVNELTKYLQHTLNIKTLEFGLESNYEQFYIPKDIKNSYISINTKQRRNTIRIGNTEYININPTYNKFSITNSNVEHIFNQVDDIVQHFEQNNKICYKKLTNHNLQVYLQKYYKLLTYIIFNTENNQLGNEQILYRLREHLKHKILELFKNKDLASIKQLLKFSKVSCKSKSIIEMLNKYNQFDYTDNKYVYYTKKVSVHNKLKNNLVPFQFLQETYNSSTILEKLDINYILESFINQAQTLMSIKIKNK